MTKQTKHYIELTDILALRLECKQCHAALTLLPGDIENRILSVCPSCHYSWAVLSETSYAALFSEFASALGRLTRTLYGHKQMPPAPLGFTLTLEISAAEPDNHATGLGNKT